MSNAFRWIPPILALLAVAAPAQAGMAVFGFTAIEQQAPGNLPGEQMTAITDIDVMGGHFIGGTIAYQFTFGPDSNIEQSDGAGSLITHLDVPPHDSVGAANGAWTVLNMDSKTAGTPSSAYSSQVQGGGGLFWTHGLSSGGGGGLLGGGAMGQGANNTSSQSHLTSFAAQLASSNLALDHIPSGVIPIVIGKSLILEREIPISSPITAPADLLAGGTGGGSPDFTPPSLGRIDSLSFHVSGMAPEPGSLIVWGLIGLVFGAAGWRHRRRLLALA